MSNKDWLRVRKDIPCPICGHPDWCLISVDGTAAICARVESKRPCRESGWIHDLDGKKTNPEYLRKAKESSESAPERNDLPILAENWKTAINPERLKKLAASLGLNISSLKRLEIGWSTDSSAWSFPMKNASEKVVGIRLRLETGRKFAVRGGHEGLFIPTGIPDASPILIAEGPTDTAALLDLGFQAVGRPSCRGGVAILSEYLELKKMKHVVIVSDNDTPGIEGAKALAQVLGRGRDVRLIKPPDGIKDAREWRKSGATSDDIRNQICRNIRI